MTTCMHRPLDMSLIVNSVDREIPFALLHMRREGDRERTEIRVCRDCGMVYVHFSVEAIARIEEHPEKASILGGGLQ